MKEFFNNKTNRILSASALILVAALFLFLRFFVRQSGIPVVLHYNVGGGADYFGEVRSVFILPAVGLIIFLVNFLLAAEFWKKDRALSYFLSSTSVLAQFFLFIAGIALYLINK